MSHVGLMVLSCSFILIHLFWIRMYMLCPVSLRFCLRTGINVCLTCNWIVPEAALDMTWSANKHFWFAGWCGAFVRVQWDVCANLVQLTWNRHTAQSSSHSLLLSLPLDTFSLCRARTQAIPFWGSCAVSRVTAKWPLPGSESNAAMALTPVSPSE